MRELPSDWARCQPTKCKHNKDHCARFSSQAIPGAFSVKMDFSIVSKGDKCAGYEWNGSKSQ